MKNKLARISVPLGLSFFLAYPSAAQEQVNFGRSPSINVLATPNIDKNDFIFSPQNGFTCPTTSLSFGGFGTGGNDWANDFTSYASAGSGISNFGAGVGLTIPLGMKYRKSCYDYAKSLAAKANAQSEEAQRNNQLTLLRQCYWLLRYRINLEQPAFAEGGAFSSLQSCKTYTVEMVQGGSNNSGNKVNTAIPELDPPLSKLAPPPCV